jgi:hypothetical protein
MKLKQRVISNAVMLYRYEKKFYLPLGEVMRAVEFPITVDPDQKTASGWFVKEGRSFKLDYSEKQVEIQGRESPFSEDSLFFFSMSFT